MAPQRDAHDRRSDACPPRVRVRHDGEEHETDLHALDDDLRRGLLPPEAELQAPALTGDAWMRVDAVPALAEALDAPGARLAAQFRRRGLPQVTVATCALLTLCALTQALMGWPAAEATDEVTRVAAGQGPSLLAGRWWTLLSCHLVHAPEAPFIHLISNMGIIAYCGTRVEQALGWSGALRALLGATVGASLLLGLFSETPTVGSSGLAFGLWAAQIAIGFREGDAIPARHRRVYGYGNLVLFVPLYVGDLGAEGVSDLAHLGGLLGGAGSVLIGAVAACAPAAVARATAQRAVLRAGFALVLVIAGVPLLGAVGGAPLLTLALGGAVPVALEGADARLELPNAMQLGMENGWSSSTWTDAPYGADAALAWVAEPVRSPSDLPVDPPLEVLVGRSPQDASVEAVAAPAPLIPHSTSAAFHLLPRHEDEPSILLITHTIFHGTTRLTLAEQYQTQARARPTTGAAALMQGIVQSLALERPQALVEAEAALDRSPFDRVLTFRTAIALTHAGQWAQADALLATLSAGEDGVAWDATRARLWLWALARTIAGAELDLAAPTTWISPRLDTPVTDLPIHRDGMLWLMQRGDCAQALPHIRQWEREAEDWIQTHPHRTEDVDALSSARDELRQAAAEDCPVPRPVRKLDAAPAAP